MGYINGEQITGLAAGFAVLISVEFVAAYIVHLGQRNARIQERRLDSLRKSFGGQIDGLVRELRQTTERVDDSDAMRKMTLEDIRKIATRTRRVERAVADAMTTFSTAPETDPVTQRLLQNLQDEARTTQRRLAASEKVAQDIRGAFADMETRWSNDAEGIVRQLAEKIDALAGRTDEAMGELEASMESSLEVRVEAARRQTQERTDYSVNQIRQVLDSVSQVGNKVFTAATKVASDLEHERRRLNNLEDVILSCVSDGQTMVGSALGPWEPEQRPSGAMVAQNTDASAEHGRFPVPAIAQQLSVASRTSAEISSVRHEIETVGQRTLTSQEDIRRMRRELSALRNDFTAGAGRLADVIRKLTALEHRSDEDHGVVLDMSAASKRQELGYRRGLSADDLLRLESLWVRPLGLQISRTELEAMGKHIYLGAAGLRRTSTSALAATVLEVLLARSIERETLSILEVGTWVGSDTELIFDLCADRFEDVQIAVVDPRARDEEAPPKVATRRRSEHGNHAETVARLSRPRAADRLVDPDEKCDLLVLDGDRSVEGLRRDLADFCPRLRPAGYLVLHGYGNPGWPAVAVCADALQTAYPTLERVGDGWQLAVFRMRPSPSAAPKKTGGERRRAAPV